MLTLGLNLGEVTHARNKGGGFDLNVWKAAQLGGFDFDYTKTDRNLQEANGPTPVSAVDHLIRLSLSDRLWGGRTLEQYLATHPELLTNGGFDNGIAGWTTQNSVGTSVSGGELTLTRASSALERLAQSVVAVAGRTYALTITSRNGTGWPTVRVSGVDVANVSEPSLVTRTYFFTAASASPEISLGVGGTTSGTSRFDSVSVKEVSRAAATQATASFAPKWDPTLGAKWDGTDDRQLSNVGPVAGNNLLIARVAFPAVVTGNPIFAGARGSLNTRFFLAIESGAGRLAAGVGAQSTGTINAGPDLRGQSVVVGLANSGSQVRLFVGDAKVYEAAQSGVVEPTVPLTIGGFNDNGTPGLFFPGSTARVSLFHTTEFVDTDLFRRIAASY